MYDINFYNKTLRKDRQHSYKIIVNYLYKHLKPNSVIDFGCGAGWFLYYFYRKGISLDNLMGIEPSSDAFEIMDNKIYDITIKDFLDKRIFNISKMFDLAMNIEVLEHIEEKNSDIVLQNITQNTNKLIFSAAYSGQGGVGHINERPFDYWEKRLNKLNFYNDKKFTDNFRKFLKDNNANKWYYTNISLFKRVDR